MDSYRTRDLKGPRAILTSGAPPSISNLQLPTSPRLKPIGYLWFYDIDIGSEENHFIMRTALLAVLAGSAFASDATLYCVAPNADFSISTLNNSLPQAKCFRVQDGLFTQVLKESVPWAEKPVYLAGHVLPGIIESHGHILQYGEMLESVLLYGAESINEVKTRIKSFLNVHSEEGYGTRDKWLRGIGWDQAFFDGVMPTAVRLFSISTLNYVH